VLDILHEGPHMPDLLDLTPASPIVERLPEPEQIRARLSELAAESDLLRAMLRLLERRECGRRVMRSRRQARGREVCHAP
jgi:hypothetical protein